jgi:amino acid transporter
MPNLEKLFDLRFWFALRPEILGPRAVRFLIVVFGAILVAALVLKIVASMKKKNPPLAKLFRKLQRLFLTMGLLGFVLLFLSYEQIYLLGSHFWYLLWLIGFLTWLGFIIYYLVVKMPKEKDELEKKKRFEKYLPR